jgi:peptidoglycan L-alanyl-D-glutamate endopeptidase CwlK
MINSRDVAELHPVVQAKAKAFIAECHAQGIDLIVTSTYRDFASQNALYAQGRTAPGKKVTNAKGGQSFHNFRVAFDIVPMRAGKPVWNTSGADGDLWRRVGGIGKAHGLEWGGDFKSIKDMPHFQYTNGLTLADFNAGKTLNA